MLSEYREAEIKDGVVVREAENPLIKYKLHYLDKSRQSLITLMLGDTHIKTGSGKSYGAMEQGVKMDTGFNINKVVYHPKDFMRCYDLIENEFQENHRICQVVVVDEGEITAPAALWYSFTNRAIGYTLATFRYLQSEAIFVAPAWNWLDKRVRVLSSHVGYCSKHFKNFETGEQKPIVKMKFFQVRTDLFGDKIYLRKPQMYNATKQRIETCKSITVGLIPDDLAKAYEEKSRKFKKNLREDLAITIDRFEEYEQKSNMKKDIVFLNKIATELIDTPYVRQMLQADGKVTLTTIQNTIMDKYGLTHNECSRIRDLIEQLWSGAQKHD